MADDLGNEDQWLYGDSNPDQPEENSIEKSSEILNDVPPCEETEIPEEKEASEELPPPEVNENLPVEETNGNKENGDTFDKMDSDEEEDEDDDSDDDVNVVIGDIKTSTTYTSLNIKRGGLMSSSGAGDKSKPQPGKFSIEEFESIGTINGVPAQEFNLDSLEDKPWRKPGADITDYFNYGFNEDTWRAYCERQKRMRVHESGAGLLPMNPSGLIRSTSSITNENSKYSGSYLGPRKAGPPPGRRMMGSIDVIGGNSGLASRRVIDTVKATPPKENVIQVMTADRREYSRKVPTFPDVSVPPPGGPGVFDAPPVGAGGGGSGNSTGPGFGNEYPNEFYSSDVDPYYQSYEPTQEQQWAISTITPISLLPSLGPPGMPGDVPPSVPGIHGSGSQRSLSVQPPMSSPMMDSHSQDGYRNHEPREDSSGRDREREHQSRDRSEKPDRHRDRTHKRDRSRSRSRRHKSRSRSPSHRSHKKKKSKRHDSESE